MAKSLITGPGNPKNFTERTQILAAQRNQGGKAPNRTVIITQPAAPVAPAVPVPPDPSPVPNAAPNVLGVTQMTVANTSGLPVAVDDQDPRVQVFGASGTNHSAGIVPDPGASAGTTRYLREDATWATPAGGSGTPPADEIVGSGSDYAITGTYAAIVTGVNIALTVPSAGDYLFQATIAVSEDATHSNDSLYAQFYNNSTSAAIAGSERLISDISQGQTGQLVLKSIITTLSANTISVQIKNATAARGTVTAANTDMTYVAVTKYVPPAFDPFSVGSLLLYLDPDTQSYANTDPVSSFVDSTTNHFDFAQATGTNQPVFRTNYVNGRSVIDFDGINDYLQAASRVIPLSNFTFYFVLASNTNGGTDRPFGFENSGSGSNGLGFYSTGAGLPDTLIIRNAGTNGDISGSTPTVSQFYLYSVDMSGTGTIFKRGVTTLGTSALTAFTDAGVNGTLGAAGSAGNNWKGQYGKVLIYDNSVTPLSPTDKTNIENWLTTYYAL